MFHHDPWLAGWTCAKNLDQLYRYVNHHKTTTNLSDIVWCMSDGVWWNQDLLADLSIAICSSFSSDHNFHHKSPTLSPLIFVTFKIYTSTTRFTPPGFNWPLHLQSKRFKSLLADKKLTHVYAKVLAGPR